MPASETPLTLGEKCGDSHGFEDAVCLLDTTIPGCELSVSRATDGWRAHVVHAPTGMGFRSLRPHPTPSLAIRDAVATLMPRYEVHLDWVRSREHVAEVVL